MGDRLSVMSKRAAKSRFNRRLSSGCRFHLDYRKNPNLVPRGAISERISFWIVNRHSSLPAASYTRSPIGGEMAIASYLALPAPIAQPAIRVTVDHRSEEH